MARVGPFVGAFKDRYDEEVGESEAEVNDEGDEKAGMAEEKME